MEEGDVDDVNQGGLKLDAATVSELVNMRRSHTSRNKASIGSLRLSYSLTTLVL